MGWLRCLIEQVIKSHDERHQGLGLGAGQWQRDRMLWNGVDVMLDISRGQIDIGPRKGARLLDELLDDHVWEASPTHRI
jgi:hypothetical protein